MSLEPYTRFRAEFAAIDPERYPAEYIERQVERGRWRCFGNERAAMLAEIKVYPSGLKEVHCVCAAGDMAEIVALAPIVEAWGRKCGCKGAEVVSRPEWARVLASHGYRVTQARLWKEF